MKTGDKRAVRLMLEGLIPSAKQWNIPVSKIAKQLGKEYGIEGLDTLSPDWGVEDPTEEELEYAKRVVANEGNQLGGCYLL